MKYIDRCTWYMFLVISEHCVDGCHCWKNNQPLLSFDPHPLFNCSFPDWKICTNLRTSFSWTYLNGQRFNGLIDKINFVALLKHLIRSSFPYLKKWNYITIVHVLLGIWIIKWFRLDVSFGYECRGQCRKIT